MTDETAWSKFSTEYIDPATGFRWHVDCLGAISTNQLAPEACTLQFQYGDKVRFALADPYRLENAEEIAEAFSRSESTPPRKP